MIRKSDNVIFGPGISLIRLPFALPRAWICSPASFPPTANMDLISTELKLHLWTNEARFYWIKWKLDVLISSDNASSWRRKPSESAQEKSQWAHLKLHFAILRWSSNACQISRIPVHMRYRIRFEKRNCQRKCAYAQTLPATLHSWNTSLIGLWVIRTIWLRIYQCQSGPSEWSAERVAMNRSNLLLQLLQLNDSIQIITLTIA